LCEGLDTIAGLLPQRASFVVSGRRFRLRVELPASIFDGVG
jgi:hypothetical protein